MGQETQPRGLPRSVSEPKQRPLLHGHVPADRAAWPLC